MASLFRPGSPGHILYNILLVACVVIAAPAWILMVLVSPKQRTNFPDRLGFRGLPSEAPGGEGPTIWLHAVSVGETNASVPLLRELKKRVPGARLLLSNVTVTGRGTAGKALAGVVGGRFYFPFDFPGVCGRFLDRVRPDVVVIVETELWPNFLAGCARRGIPVVIANGRLSDRSFRGYSRVRWFFGPVLRTVSAISAQTREDADRFLALGADPASVTVGGNLKFDASLPVKGSMPLSGILERARADGVRWIVAGSTHEGEEAVVLRAFAAARGIDPAVRLLLAPRHPERFAAVLALLAEQGIASVRRTSIPDADGRFGEAVLLLDTVGELPGAYAAADLAFVGGSLVPKGGHNVLEPAMYGVPTVVGPHMDNFREIADLFLGKQGLLQVGGEEELASTFSRFAASPDAYAAVGQEGKTLFEKLGGASERNSDAILAAMRRRAARP